MFSEIISKKYRWFIWTIIIIVVVGVSLTTYAYITGVNIEAETSEIVFSFHASRKGKIEVVSNPKGAKIYLDNKDTGKETNAEFTAKPGDHILKLTKDGYKDYIENIEVEKGETIEVNAILEEGEGITEAPVDETADWETYRDEEYGYEIKYPEDYTFKEAETEMGGMRVSFFSKEFIDSQGEYPDIRVSLDSNLGLDVESWWRKTHKDSVDVATVTYIKVADIDSLKVKDPLGLIPHTDAFIPRNSKIYSISSTVNDGIFDQMLFTFRFTE